MHFLERDLPAEQALEEESDGTTSEDEPDGALRARLLTYQRARYWFRTHLDANRGATVLEEKAVGHTDPLVRADLLCGSPASPTFGW